MKITYILWTSDDWYCLYCGTLWKCIDRLFYNSKTYNYRDITDYSIYKVKHRDDLTLDWGMAWDCYFLDENWEIPENDDELLSNWKLINLKKSDLEFIKKHLSFNN